MPASTARTRTEWCFDASDIEVARRWLASLGRGPAGIAISPDGERQLHDVFLDTTDRRLEAAGRTLRIRLLGDGAEATLEPLGGAGTKSQHELCERLPDTAFAAPTTAPGPVGERLRTLCGRSPLTVLYEAQTRRERYVLAAGAREVGELLLDEVEVLRDDARPLGRRCTITVNAESGAASKVAAFVGALRAAEEVAAPPVRVEAVPLLPPRNSASRARASDATSVGEFVAAHLRAMRRELGAWEFGARAADDGEALHRMRVATRRSLAVLELFASELPSSSRGIRAELKWLSSVLGQVLELDAPLARLDEWRAPPAAGALEVTREDLVPLRTMLVAERDMALGRMIEAFDSPRYRALLNDLVSFAEECEGNAGSLVLMVAPRLIARQYRRVRRSTSRLSSGSAPGDVREVRTLTRRLRDATMLLSGEYGRPARRLARDAHRLQKTLGLHQDAVATFEYLWRRGRDGTSGLPPATLFAMGVLAERQRVDAARMPIPRARRFGRKSWPSLRRRMRRKRAQVASIPRPVVLEAHGLGLGAAQVPGDEDRDSRSVAVPTPEGTGSGTPADVERAGAPPIDGRGHPSAMRRLVGGVLSLLG